MRASVAMLYYLDLELTVMNKMQFFAELKQCYTCDATVTACDYSTLT